MKPGVGARLHAANLVGRVLDEGAHSNVLLDHMRDVPESLRARVHRLTMDTLRWLPHTEPAIAAASSRRLDDLDPMVRSVLRVAATELALGRDPHGVVDSSVEAVREGGVRAAAGFVNAVLRSLVRSGEPVAVSPSDQGAAGASVPAWIRDALVAQWGAQAADAFLLASLEPPPIGVRWRGGADLRGVPVTGVPGTSYVDARSDVPDPSGGTVMDPSSAAVARAVEAGPGMSVLDLAAAPGNKTIALWDQMEGVGDLVAADRHARRARSAARRLRRLGVGAMWVVTDGSHPPFAGGTFDRILIDAPCSGLGTLRRRPEIKLTLDPEAPSRLGRTQRDLLEAGVELLAPGGRLVYAVCTVFAEETVDVVAGFDGRPPAGLTGWEWGGGTLLAPHLTSTDGMFISVIER